ncbi:MAG TPA: metallophosphoesterase [Thiobacillus sp.]|nr:metallophosphoesterase [Thiobacillus sp.]
MSKELDNMLTGITPENRHAEVDFGEAVGREVEARLSMTVFKSFPPNEHGHDFVVGDLHGHRQKLFDELGRVGFDFEKDRLFCTGDLIDRGPDSFGTLELILEPWFHYVLGNHEDDLVYTSQDRLPMFDDWTYLLREHQFERMRKALLPALRNAPVMLRVEGEHGFWMVHADRGEFASYGTGSRLWLLDDEVLPAVDENNINQVGAFLWSRRLMRELDSAGFVEIKDHGLFLSAAGQEFVAGVGLTFVGHYTVQRPILYRSHLFIDTGMGTHPEGRLTVLRVRDVLESLDK